MAQPRTPQGVPTGGQFAAAQHTESTVILDDPASTLDWAAVNHGMMPSRGSRSPWGAVDYTDTLAPGIVQVSTAGHGGIKLSAKRNAAVDPAWRTRGGWYEEDCEAAIAVISHPGDFPDSQVEQAHKTARDFFPDQYEKATGTRLAPGESLYRDQDVWSKEHANDQVVIAAIGYTDENGTQMCVLHALTGGRSEHSPADATSSIHLVPSDEYKTRSGNPMNAYVVDPAKFPPITENEALLVEHRSDLRRLEGKAAATPPGAEREAILKQVELCRTLISHVEQGAAD